MISLAKKDECTGCGACANCCTHGAINMCPDEEGFLIPDINANCCVECHLCEKSCPVLKNKSNTNLERPRAFAVWSVPDRTVSSSGGAFSAFARLILSKGGVVFGAAFDENLYCKHKEVNTVDGLDALRGSKYVQSDIGDTFKRVRELLQQDKYVLYCGTPCQIAGLRSFLRKKFDKLLTLDVVCHGVPSNEIFQSYLSKFSTRYAGKGKVDGFEFRQRNGWGKAPSVSFDGKFTPIYDVDNLYMSAFDKNTIFRKSCYTCLFAKLPRVGDCSIADFWGIGRHGIPFKQNVLKGVSLVLANNVHGLNFLKDLKTDDVFIEERNLDEALIDNHNISHPSVLPEQRNDIIGAFLDPAMPLNAIDKHYKLVDRSLKGTVKKYALKYHFFDYVKSVYNKIKSL